MSRLTSRSDDLPMWKAIIGLVSFGMGMLLLMQILERLPMEFLVCLLVGMFVIGFVLPSRRKV